MSKEEIVKNIYLSDSNSIQIYITVNPGSANFSDIFNLVVASNELYTLRFPRNKLTLRSEDFIEITDFNENAQKYSVVKPAIFTENVSREHIFKLMESYVSKGNFSKEWERIEKRFPKDKFGDKFPYSATLEYLFNNYIS